MRGSVTRKIKATLGHPAPGVVCYACGDDERREAYVAAVAHTAGCPEPLPDDACVRDAVQVDATLGKIYSAFNGLHLFDAVVREPRSAELGVAEGFRLFRLDELTERTAETREQWLRDLSDWPEPLPYGPDDFVSIGHPCGSWNYVHLVVRGPARGLLFWWPWTMPPESIDDATAGSTAELINALIDDPAFVLNEVFCCYSRYSDGETETQWIPSRYVSDRNRAVKE